MDTPNDPLKSNGCEGGNADRLKDDDKGIRSLFSQAFTFVGAAAEGKNLPTFDLPEVAFLGRSNVGKSSLINALTHRKALARVSRTPGRTRQINFFKGSQRLILADLPGYGYAKAPKQEIALWNVLVPFYLRYRKSLKCVYLLIDARHGFKDSDRGVMDYLDVHGVPYQIILTKGDKVKPQETQECFEKILRELKGRPQALPHVLRTSSRQKQGIEDVQRTIARLIIEDASL